MTIDRKALDQLLAMNDRQLKAVIQHLAKTNGIDLGAFNIDTGSIESIRRALSTANDEDLRRIAEQYEANRKRRG